MSTSFHHPTRRRRWSTLCAGLGAIAVGVTACGQDVPMEPEPTGTPETVVVGVGPTQQSRTVAHVWALALEDAGIPTEISEVEGGRAGYLDAVEDGQIDLYPDYTGDLYLELRGTAAEGPGTAVDAEDPSASPQPTPSPTPTATSGNLVDTLANMLGQGQQGVTDDDVEAALTELLPESVQTLDAAAAENKRVLTVTAATEAKLSLNSIGDLSDHCPDLTFGALTGEDQAVVTAAAVEDTYNCTPGEVRDFTSQSEVTQALLDGEIDVAALLSATPVIEDNSLQVLEDDRDALVPERVIPVAGEQLSDQAVSEVNGISGQLDTDALVLLTRMTTSSTPYSPQEAADYWYGTVRP